MTPQEAILALRASGMSWAAIGRLVGRDRGLVRRIGLGQRPGSRLGPALNRAAANESAQRVHEVVPPVPEIPRRRVRTRPIHGPRAGSVSLSIGHQAIRGGAKSVRNEAARWNPAASAIMIIKFNNNVVVPDDVVEEYFGNIQLVEGGTIVLMRRTGERHHSEVQAGPGGTIVIRTTAGTLADDPLQAVETFAAAHGWQPASRGEHWSVRIWD